LGFGTGAEGGVPKPTNSPTVFGFLILVRLLEHSNAALHAVIHKAGRVCQKRSFLEHLLNASYSPNCVETEF
jgi:hypothetical protein